MRLSWPMPCGLGVHMSTMQGDYVVLTAEPLCICGIDVAAPQKKRNGKPQPAADLLKAFQQQFTGKEVKKSLCAAVRLTAWCVFATLADPALHHCCSGSQSPKLVMMRHSCKRSRSIGA